jgi:ABC-type antimicrobial peptide transport system permease subunit
VRGRLRVIWRLASGDLRRRKGQSLLLAVVILVTTGTLTLALGLRHVGQGTFASTRATTRGPDVVVALGPGTARGPVAVSRLNPLLHDRAVRDALGPLPLAFVHLRAPGVNVAVQAEGRTTRATTIDRPKLVAGTWVRAGGVVLERGLASSLGLSVGDHIRLGARRFEVTGIAVSTAQPFYPAQTPGILWLTAAAARRLATRTVPLGYLLELRLARPSQIDGFLNSGPVNRFAQVVHDHREEFQFTALSFIRHDDHKLVALNEKVLLFGSWLLAMLALTSIAILIGGRMAEQTRRVGLLKAVGATPGLVTFVLLSETLILAIGGAFAGLIAGSLLAPSFASPGNGLLGSSGSAQIDITDAAAVLGVAVVIATTATLFPAVRGARVSTVAALTGTVPSRRRRRRLLGISARLPAPLSLAMRLVGRQTRRTMFNILGLMVAVAMVVAAITVQHNLNLASAGVGYVPPITYDANASRADHVLIALSLILVVLAATTAAFTAWATVLDARRSSALARALGATPREVSNALTVAQMLPALIAASVGIPAGLGLYQLAGGHLSEARPPLLWLIAVIPLTLLVVAGLTTPPARVSARRPVADVLRSQ